MLCFPSPSVMFLLHGKRQIFRSIFSFIYFINPIWGCLYECLVPTVLLVVIVLEDMPRWFNDRPVDIPEQIVTFYRRPRLCQTDLLAWGHPQELPSCLTWGFSSWIFFINLFHSFHAQSPRNYQFSTSQSCRH